MYYESVFIHKDTMQPHLLHVQYTEHGYTHSTTCFGLHSFNPYV